MEKYKITFLDKNRNLTKGIFEGKNEDTIKNNFEKKGLSIILMENKENDN